MAGRVALVAGGSPGRQSDLTLALSKTIEVNHQQPKHLSLDLEIFGHSQWCWQPFKHGNGDESARSSDNSQAFAAIFAGISLRPILLLRVVANQTRQPPRRCASVIMPSVTDFCRHKRANGPTFACNKPLMAFRPASNWLKWFRLKGWWFFVVKWDAITLYGIGPTIGGYYAVDHGRQFHPADTAFRVTGVTSTR